MGDGVLKPYPMSVFFHDHLIGHLTMYGYPMLKPIGVPTNGICGPPVCAVGVPSGPPILIGLA